MACRDSAYTYTEAAYPAAGIYRKDVEAFVHKAVAAANDAVLIQANLQYGDVGTTAVLALDFEKEVLIGHVGDSQAMLCQSPSLAANLLHRQEAQHLAPHAAAISLYQLQPVSLTVSHSPDREDEHARILASGGFVSKATVGKNPSQSIASTIQTIRRLHKNASCVIPVDSVMTLFRTKCRAHA